MRRTPERGRQDLDDGAILVFFKTLELLGEKVYQEM